MTLSKNSKMIKLSLSKKGNARFAWLFKKNDVILLKSNQGENNSRN